MLESDKDSNYKPVYNIPVHSTPYPKEIKDFWNIKRRADKAIKGFERNIQRGADPIQFGLQHEETKHLAEEFREKCNELKKAAEQKTDEYEYLERLVNESEEVSLLSFSVPVEE